MDLRSISPLALALAVAACVPSRSAVFEPVDREVKRRLGSTVGWSDPDDHRAADAVRAMLAKPIDVETAVRIALSRNRHLQARFEELGIAASELAAATVLPPTTVDFDHKFGGGGETELVAVQDVLALLQIGQRRGAGHAAIAAARARAVAATVELAAHVEIAFDDLVAAQQEVELVHTAFEAADASATLVERQHAAGNTTDLALAREREMRERMRVEVDRAEQVVAERRARLAGWLELPADGGAWTTTARLPDPPATLPALDDLERVALDASLEASALAADADAAAARHRYAVLRAFLPELGAGVAVARRDAGVWEVGPAIRIGVPLFDQQQAPRARAIADERRARHELASTQAVLRATVAAARSRVVQAFGEVHQLHDVVLPLRQRVLDETVLQYNAMNANTFELLMARRDLVDIGRQYIDALRRYWDAIAEVKALRRGARAMTEELR